MCSTELRVNSGETAYGGFAMGICGAAAKQGIVLDVRSPKAHDFAAQGDVFVRGLMGTILAALGGIKRRLWLN